MATGGTGELEFEAPLARFDVDEWTEFHNDDDDDCGAGKIPIEIEAFNEPNGIRIPSERGSSGSSNMAETFSETCSGSLEDLVNTFDQRVTKCCRNYDEVVEQLAPVQIRTEDEALSTNCQNWYTLTGTFGNLPPINWSHFSTRIHRKSHNSQEASQASEDDVEDDEELFCTIDELDECGSDLFNTSRHNSRTEADIDDDCDSIDNADDVINELESLLEDHEELDSPGGHNVTHTAPASSSSPQTHQISQTSVHKYGPSTPTSTMDGVWFEESVKKLSTSALNQLVTDLTRVVVDHTAVLRHELALNEQLKVENQLQRELIGRTLSIERRQRQQVRQCELSDDDSDVDDNELIERANGDTYLSTVIPYRHNEPLTIHHLRIYISLLSAIDEDSPTVPRLLTDYILKVLCPAT